MGPGTSLLNSQISQGSTSTAQHQSNNPPPSKSPIKKHSSDPSLTSGGTHAYISQLNQLNAGQPVDPALGPILALSEAYSINPTIGPTLRRMQERQQKATPVAPETSDTPMNFELPSPISESEADLLPSWSSEGEECFSRKLASPSQNCQN